MIKVPCIICNSILMYRAIIQYLRTYVQEYVPKLVCMECAQHLTRAHVMLAGKERAVMRVSIHSK